MEGYDAVRPLLVERFPCHAMVRMLLGDLSIPLPLVAPHFPCPEQPSVVPLLNSLDAIHELRKRLELGPLVVRRRDGYADLDRFFDRLHVFLQRLAASRAKDGPLNVGSRWGERQTHLAGPP